MSTRSERFWCGLTCWGAAALAAALVFVMLILLGGWSLIQAIWAAGVTVLVLGLAFQALLCRPLSSNLSTRGSARNRAGSTAAAGTSGVSPATATAAVAARAPEPNPEPKPEPEQAPAAEAGTDEAPTTEPGPRKPVTLAAPEGAPDELKRIKGIGRRLEELLYSMGIYHYRQIAAWGPDEVAWCDDNLQGFKGRVSRDDWVGQAKILAAGGETEFSRRSDGG